MVDLGGYVIVLVEQNNRIKLYGSPAERSDCDEILEINGKSLESATHQEIIHHIHQCIRSRTICLRVKRRTSGRLAIDSSPIDAFVIGSRAREHLQQIANNTTITPRDIAQLSKILSETEDNAKPLITTTATTHEPVGDNKTAAEETAKQAKSKSQPECQEEIGYYELSDENMELVELSASHNLTSRQQHRELPVDVPDSFIGVVKQTPRYPPPQPSQRATNQNPQPDKIRKYSEEVNRKKTEEEFLRSSLRGSKKLQQLEQKCQQQPQELHPAVNNAFEPDDDVEREENKVFPIPDLNSILERLINNLNGEVKDVINQSNLAKLIAIYTTIMQQQQKQNLSSLAGAATPTTNTTDLVQEVILLLQEEALNTEAAELLEILTRFELEGLCYAYDHVASNCKPMETSLITPTNEDIVYDKNDVDINEETLDPSVKVVRIEKSSCEPLGATVRNEQDGSVIIGRIVKGGAAEKSGLLHEGDEILEVNGIEMKGRNVNQVCDLLAEMTGTLTFVIAARDNIKPQQNQPIIHLKALFDYDPDDDLYIPCRELGICFTKGDIVHVIDQNDMNWWQAYREGEHDQSLAGLIPSVQFQLQREAMKQSILNDNTNTNNLNNKNRQNKKTSASSLLLNCGKKSAHRRKKNRKAQSLGLTDQVLTYEEVLLYYPRANIKRPIVLIGPTNIGRHELRQRLMQDTERFAAAVPHTSRAKREGEIDAIDYHFISRQQFEQDIRDGKFVEHGEYEKNYYGTSLSAIETVVQSGKICVLNLHVHSIPLLRQGHAGAKLKPYFVFVAPPPQIDKLNRLITSTNNTLDVNNPGVTDLNSIIEEAREIEARYGHFFDMILSITDIERAYQELMHEINALEREPQWIPSIWMK